MKMNKDKRSKGIVLQYREYTFEMTNLKLFKGFQSPFIPLLEQNGDASLGVDLTILLWHALLCQRCRS